MSSFANTGFVGFRNAVQLQYVLIISKADKLDCFVSLPLRV